MANPNIDYWFNKIVKNFIPIIFEMDRSYHDSPLFMPNAEEPEEGEEDEGG